MKNIKSRLYIQKNKRIRRDESRHEKMGRKIFLLLKFLFENQQSVSLNITFNIQFE